VHGLAPALDDRRATFGEMGGEPIELVALRFVRHAMDKGRSGKAKHRTAVEQCIRGWDPSGRMQASATLQSAADVIVYRARALLRATVVAGANARREPS
jgi:hypothetical protein